MFIWRRPLCTNVRDVYKRQVVALMSQGLTDSSFKYHLESAKKNGVTKTEIAEILTHAAFPGGRTGESGHVEQRPAQKCHGHDDETGEQGELLRLVGEHPRQHPEAREHEPGDDDCHQDQGFERHLR